jgi:hypothetical protein
VASSLRGCRELEILVQSAEEIDMRPEPESISDSTALNVWRFSSVMTTAMTMSAAVAHLMEMPGKMEYEPPLYVRLHRTLYPTFGRTAGPAEAVAVAATGVLAWVVRRRHRPSSGLMGVAAGCLAAAHAIFWGVVQPANVTMMRWPLDAIPEDWAKWRSRWEYGHAVRAGLVTTALSALTWSLVQDSANRGKTLATVS